MQHERRSEALRAMLESSRVSFHSLLDSLSDEDLHRRSNNPGWTNGEVLFHIVFAFMLIPKLVPLLRLWGRLPARYSRVFAHLLNGATPVFNWINAIGARGGGKIYTRDRIRMKYDRVHLSILRKLDAIPNDEWSLGMYYPDRWDALFDEYMTLEEVFCFPMRHFAFHLKQVSQ